jgi:hypothetical protein
MNKVVTSILVKRERNSDGFNISFSIIGDRGRRFG